MRNKLFDSSLVVYIICATIYGTGGVVVMVLSWRGWTGKINKWVPFLALFGLNFLGGLWLAYSGFAVGSKFRKVINYN
jgi:Cu/Ag efflux pump CusA